MKKNYKNPEMTVRVFVNERLMTDSGIGESAESKAANVLNESGTTQNVTVKWSLQD